ncbi:protein of unknown function [Geodermatophilus obscurus]|uniref:Bacteriocin-protection, YdeI or OmpD-Associated n=1 Tax=Geodermatophilus obscurus TaxID=1861 RepID=A0A1I5GMU6_9ACTN|nr:YdeI/OmpD-associated family protein [Geodermatophilus obscurus]SFO37272.1 protein of unknown function [Geodermatophilus obscurus]
MTEQRSVTFETTLAASGNNTGIEVPPELVEQLGAGRRPPVLVDLDGHAYRSTVAVMGGRYLVSVSAAVRQATGLTAGDPVRVTLTLADTPREVDVPADLAAALAADEQAGAFFATLSNSLQRYHVDTVNGAKTAETRQRRIGKAVALFRAGQKR